MHLTFFIPGNPKALKRHRAVRRLGHVGSYDPSRADKADLVAKWAKAKEVGRHWLTGHDFPLYPF